MASRKRKSKDTRTFGSKSTTRRGGVRPARSKSRDRKKRREVNTPSLPISSRRLWLFRILAATVVPAVFLLLTEFLLWAIGFGYSTNAIISYSVNNTDVYCNNLKFGWTFFPKNISREPDEFVFPTTKRPHTFRIFILGASAAYGEPDSSYSFGRILQVLLESKYDGVDFQVINTGMPAINSHAVLKIAEDCASYEPDLFLVYLGNNEVVGPYGAGTVFSPLSSSIYAIRASIALKSTRIGQLLQESIGLLKPQNNSLRTWRGMAMFLDNQVRFDSTALDYVYRHFEGNLTDICAAGVGAKARVILCNVSSNLKDSPPFASQPRSDRSAADDKNWRDLYQKGVARESDGVYAQALQHYLSAARLDDNVADLHFRMGRCYQAMGDYVNAKNSYVKARDLDTLRFRADTHINDIIRTVANNARNGVSFVDTVSAFENNSANAIPGSALFYEHVHFTFKGSYLLARTVFEKIENMLPQEIKQAENDHPVPSEKDCIDYLSFTGWDRLRILQKVLKDFISKPPFTNQIYHENSVKEIQKQIDSLSQYTLPQGLEESAAIYKRAVERSPTDWNLHFRYAEFLRKGLTDYDEAIAQYRVVVQHMPYYVAYNNLGTLLFDKGNVDEAIAIYREGLERKDTSAELHYNLALALENKQDVEGTIEHCSRSLEINPESDVSAYHLLARAYLRSEENDKAINVLLRALELYPNDANSHFGLGTVYFDTGKTEQAIKELNTVLRLQPDHKMARQLLERFGAVAKP